MRHWKTVLPALTFLAGACGGQTVPTTSLSGSEVTIQQPAVKNTEVVTTTTTPEPEPVEKTEELPPEAEDTDEEPSNH